MVKISAARLDLQSARLDNLGQAAFAAEYDNGNSGTSITVDWKVHGNLQKVTRTGNCTYTFTAPTGPASLLLKMVHEASATAYTVTFSPVPKYPGGAAPTWTNTSGAVDIITFYFDGTNYYGIQNGAFA